VGTGPRAKASVVRTKAFVGLDVHRKLVVATAVNSSGKRIRQSSFGPTPGELKKFLARLPKPTKVVLEASSVWEQYYEAAVSAGFEVVLSHPRTTRMIAEASIKTDKVDSETLARLLRLDSIPLTFAPTPEIRALRVLYREHSFYVRLKSSISRHAYSRLAARGVDYSKGALQHRRPRERLRRHRIPEVDRALDALDELEQHCNEIGGRIHEAYMASEDAQILGTVPGVGELTAIGLTAYLCPISRFSTVDKLSSYVGLCPTTRQSSDSLHHGHLKRDVNRNLRALMISVSWAHRIHAPKDDVARLSRRVARRKGKMAGSIVGAHKLLRIFYAMLKQRRGYSPHAPKGSAP
jgi:transposase